MKKNNINMGSRKMMAEWIANNEPLISPKESDVDRAWREVKAAVESEKRRPVAVRFFRLALQPAAISAAAVLACVLIILVGIVPFYMGRQDCQIRQFSGGLVIERTGIRITPDRERHVREKDRIINNSVATALLRSERSFQAALKPGSRIVFQSLRQKGLLRGDILLESGGADFHVKKLEKDESFQVRSGRFVISVVGTVFQAVQTNGGLLISTSEGRVSVRSENTGFSNTVYVGAGETLLILDNGYRKVSKIGKAVSKELEDLSGNGLEGSPGREVRFRILSFPVPSKVYINGEFAGQTPLALDLTKREKLDLEFVGNNGKVRRMFGREIRDNETISIDFLSEQGEITDFERQQIRTHPKFRSGDGYCLVTSDGTKFICRTDLRNAGEKADEKPVPVILNGRIMLTAGNGKIECHDLNGNKLWELNLPGILWYHTRISHNDTLAVLATIDKGIYVFGTNGKTAVHIPPDRTGPVYSSPVIDRNGILYFIDETEMLTAYSVQDHEVLWKARVPDVIAHPLMETADSVVSFCRSRGSLQANEKNSGRLLWKLEMPATASRDMSMRQNRDTLVLASKESQKSRLWLVDMKNGRILHEMAVGSEITALALNDERFWISTKDSMIDSYSLSTFNSVRKYYLEKPASEMIYDDRNLWVLSEKGLEIIPAGQ